MPFAPNPMAPITLTASATTLNRRDHMGPIIRLSRSAGMTVTLPAASGSGDTYSLRVATALTTSSYVIAAAGTDVLSGAVGLTTDAAGVTVPTTATSDKITMNGSTTGGLVGSHVTLTDVTSGVWQVSGFLLSTGAEATPFSES